MKNLINIYNFKKDDLITRIKPVINPETDKKDYYLIGKKLIFKGIANATIYLSIELPKEYELFSILFGVKNDKLNNIQLPLELWEDGWDFYIEPDFLDNESNESEEELLQRKLNDAAEKQQYEKAERLKRKLEELKSKNKTNE